MSTPTRDGTAATDSVPAVSGVAGPDASAAFGATIWAVAVFVGALGRVPRALALAPLVLVPLGVGMAARRPFPGVAGQCLRVAVWCQPVGALGFTASLALDVTGVTAAALAAPWLLVTGLLGLAALFRTTERGGFALPETAIDAGLAYVSVGAVALLLYHLDITFWFSSTIIRLTAVHFHYAGFVLPVVTGLTGRSGHLDTRLWNTLVSVILAGPAIIAVGISFSPLVEVVAVGGFTVAVALFGWYVLFHIVPTRPRRQAVLLGASAVALPVSMALALGYGVAIFYGMSLGLDIATMVALHGSLNAFGFALCGLVGWRLDGT
ncbi:YndJ family protein [Halovenus rubra]|uniref:YndJ family protein n=2 Tax=Halovenus rubra TaxID=869890 RepID=A0ABD5XHH2_9EURY|nr:YndJ family protein [Halovenus rubra]